MKQYDTKKLDIFYSLTSSHFEVTEGENFSVTLSISGPDAKENLKIPYRIIGSVRSADYSPSNEYGIFEIDDTLSSTITFTAKNDNYNETEEYFIVALYHIPTVQQLIVIKNIPIPPSNRPAEPVPNPPSFELVALSPEIIGGFDAKFDLICFNMRPGVKLRYYTQSSSDQYPVESYTYSEINGISSISIPTNIKTIRTQLRIWLKNHPKVESQVVILPI